MQLGDAGDRRRGPAASIWQRSPGSPWLLCGWSGWWLFPRIHNNPVPFSPGTCSKAHMAQGTHRPCLWPRALPALPAGMGSRFGPPSLPACLPVRNAARAPSAGAGGFSSSAPAVPGHVQVGQVCQVPATGTSQGAPHTPGGDVAYGLLFFKISTCAPWKDDLKCGIMNTHE